MATETHYLTGKAFWAKVQPQQLDKEYNSFSLDFFPNAEAKAILKETGVGFKWKSNEHGDYIRLRRKNSVLMNDEIVEFGAPKVVLKTEGETDGVPNTEPFKKLIGNGSTVTVRVSVYDNRSGKPGHRLEAVRIDELVPYEAKPINEREPTEDYPF